MTSGPEWTLSEDRQTMTITFPTNPPVAFKLDVSGVEEMLTNLGHMRDAMLPPIAANFSTGQMVEAVADPRWMTEPDALMGNSVLHLRDPRYGWLHYLIPKETAGQLGQSLLDQAAAPSPGLGRDRPA